MRDAVTAPADRAEIPFGPFREHGEFPESIDQSHQRQPVLPVNDSEEMDMHCRRALSDGRNPLLPSLPKGFAKTLDGADEAPRRLERTDLCPEFHQRLIDKARFSGVDEFVRLSPQTLGILLTPGLNPRQHAAHITINDWVWLVEGDAQD